jgi:hypothetical protein
MVAAYVCIVVYDLSLESCLLPVPRWGMSPGLGRSFSHLRVSQLSPSALLRHSRTAPGRHEVLGAQEQENL